MRLLLVALLLLPLVGCSGPTTVGSPVPAVAPAASPAVPLPTMDDASVFGRWYEPIEANLFVAPRASKLYIAWALPKDLMPLGAVGAPEEVEPFLVNSAWALCRRYDSRATDEQTDCLVHLLRLESNDEYTKSAAGGFSTVGKMETPRAAAMAEETEAVLADPRSAVRARFSRIDLQLAGFDPAKAREAAAANAPAGAVRGGS
jgi:hypothetical protein